jgi:hypothetical protein
MPTVFAAFVVAVVTTLLAVNLIASARVLRCPISSAGQKAAQLAVVWLLPAIGAVVALIMTRKRTEPGTGRYVEEREEIEEVAVSKPDYEGAD